MEKPTNKSDLKKMKTKKHEEPTDSMKIFPEEKLPPIDGETKQALAIRRLRSRLKPLAANPVFGPKLDQRDSTLSRWLDICDGNVFKAASKIYMCLASRRKNNLDDLLKNYRPPHLLVSSYPGGLCGEDRQGCPVSYELLGVIDAQSIMKSVRREDILLFRFYQYENIVQHLEVLSKSRSKPVTQIVIVVDMNEMDMGILWSPSFLLWTEAFRLLHDYYPELVKEVLIIRPPLMYHELYLSLKPYMGKALRLFKMLGWNFFPGLLQRIEAHQIPAYLGGYKCDYNSNPYCKTFLNWQGQIAEWSHFSDQRMGADVIRRKVEAGSQDFHELHLGQKRTLLTWEIYDMSHPFMLTVYRYKDDPKDNAVFGPVRMHPDGQYLVHGVVCEGRGLYLIKFDNWKSFDKPLKLCYSLQTTLPLAMHALNRPRVALGDTIDMTGPIDRREQVLRAAYLQKYPTYKKKKWVMKSRLEEFMQNSGEN